MIAACGLWYIVPLCNDRIFFISQSHNPWGKVMSGTAPKGHELTLTDIEREQSAPPYLFLITVARPRSWALGPLGCHFLLPGSKTTAAAQRDAKRTWNSRACLKFQLSVSLSASGKSQVTAPKKTQDEQNKVMKMYQNKSMTSKRIINQKTWLTIGWSRGKWYATNCTVD